MKTLFQFLSEARTSKAADEAKKKDLTSDRHGRWMDRSGNPVAYTDQGELVYYNKRDKKPEEEGGKRGAAQPEAGGRQKQSVFQTPTNGRKFVPFPKVNQDAVAANELIDVEDQVQQALEDAPELAGGDLEQPITITFGRFNPPTVGHEKL